MAPVPTHRLIALQRARAEEIRLINRQLEGDDSRAWSRGSVQVRIDAIKEIWGGVRTTNGELASRDDEEAEQYREDRIFAQLQGDYWLTLDKLIELNNARVSAVPGHSSAMSGGLDTYPDHRPAKLPRLDLPSFSGKYEEWENFQDLFCSMVHNALNLSDATKLQYLKSCLSGAALDLVKTVSTTDANYASTWQALKTRYANHILTINNHLTALMNMQYLRKESADGLRSLIDESQRIVRALTNLKLPVSQWNVWLNFVVADRLDPESRKLWEVHLSGLYRRAIQTASTTATDLNISTCIPTFEAFMEFLENRAQALSMIAASTRTNNRGQDNSKSTGRSTSQLKRGLHAGVSQRGPSLSRKCPLCSAAHYLGSCPRFIAKTPTERRDDARRFHLCFNCLAPHTYRHCESTRRCNSCQQKHHSLLHGVFATPSSSGSRDSKPTDSSIAKTQVAGSEGSSGEASVKVLTMSLANRKSIVLLATAQVILASPDGTQCRVRALLDQGSEASFVSEKIVQLLQLPKSRAGVPLTGIGASNSGVAKSRTYLSILSCHDERFKIETQALVLRRLTSQLPSGLMKAIDLNEFAGLQLADPRFFEPSTIDIILGADVYCRVLKAGFYRAPSSNLIAQDTFLGWIISGSLQGGVPRRAAPTTELSRAVLHCVTNNDLQESLQRFWEIEEVPQSTIGLSPEDEACEQLFVDSHSRNESGRYVVRLPLKREPPLVSSETRQIALRSLSHLQRRLSRDNKLAQSYCEFMGTYESLGHMEVVPDAELSNPRAWYLPHHPVVQVAPKWKLRVVFDASRRTSEQHSLNEYLCPGAPLQRDLTLILLHWRKYQYVFTADIVKMFRQVLIHPVDRDLHRILWSPRADVPPVEYRMRTVTYGTACAPFLAIRVLLHLAQSESHLPLGSRCLLENTYVDDVFTGASSVELAIQKRTELVKLLESAGMQLDKWATNHPSLLPNETPTTNNEVKSIDQDALVKTLGIQWSPSQDAFKFFIGNVADFGHVNTKRTVLSSISRLFDPFGWLSPITVTAKILMQDLWILRLDWDAPLPPEIYPRWVDYCKSLEAVPTIAINRWLGTSSSVSYQLHGFSDASAQAYAAAVYLRVQVEDGSFTTNLLIAKAKASPVKTVSIPNLELSGAVLLVNLICYIQKLDFLKNLPTFAWTDSQVVLAWLRKHPRSWKTFVANRVSHIQTALPAAEWRHVPTKENPADLASRGVTPASLTGSQIWWNGPSWLSESDAHWPTQPQPANVHLLRKTVTPEHELLTRFSSLNRLIRVVAYCLRPLKMYRERKQSTEFRLTFLTVSELDAARRAVLRLSQSTFFYAEIKLLSNNNPLPKRHALCKLNPFVGLSDRIMRVGGRLAHSSLSEEATHPPSLSKYSNLSRMFVRSAHKQSLHGGVTLTLSTLQRQVWIQGAKSLVNGEVRTCIVCQRVKPQSGVQLMGELPADRVTPSRPFSISGLDYAGPFQLRTQRGRGYRSYKGYIALFICFSTRAVHLEAVSDMTTESFLAAYRRFSGRRGRCRKIYSDNGTNFQGAARELREMFDAASSFYGEIATVLADEGTSWSFIPPGTPHCGGLWEAGVKSTKHHLKRIVGDHRLTFEEFSTLLVEIEACLNSRPLCPLSGDQDDLRVLTPAHFLIGEQAGILPDAGPPQVPENRLSRYQLLHRMRDNFWKRWSTEYLHLLQERSKWRCQSENFTLGQLVIMRDDRYPPSKWPLGRVIETHPGPDGLVRVVTVKTAKSTIRRHISKLCCLHLPDVGTERRPPAPETEN